MRIENVKGAVWTVDNLEYCRRRPLKLTAAASSSSTSPVSAHSFKPSSLGYANEDGGELDEDLENGSDASRKYENSEDLSLDEDDNDDDEDEDEEENESNDGGLNGKSDNQENSSFYMSANNTRKLLNESNHRRKMKRLCLSSSNHC